MSEVGMLLFINTMRMAVRSLLWFYLFCSSCSQYKLNYYSDIVRSGEKSQLQKDSLMIGR